MADNKGKYVEIMIFFQHMVILYRMQWDVTIRV